MQNGTFLNLEKRLSSKIDDIHSNEKAWLILHMKHYFMFFVYLWYVRRIVLKIALFLFEPTIFHKIKNVLNVWEYHFLRFT